MRLVEVGLGLVAGAWLLWRIPVPRHRQADRPPVAVIVPARNEASTLPTLLASVVPQLRAHDELVVVDDDSDDGTALAASAAGARVIAAAALPDGWLGKPWACATGARETVNPVLVFVDADVWFEPGGLDRVVGERVPGGLLSVQPYHVVRRPYERLSAITNVVSMMGLGAFTPTRRDPRGAFGPCLVVERAVYEDVGGHASVRDAVLDDIELAHAFRSRTRPVRVLGGRRSVSFRMYPAGLRQLVDGWTKNVALGARRASAVHGLLAFAWIAALLVAATSPLTYALAAVEIAWMLRRIGRFGLLTALLYPLPLAAFVFVFVRSLVATARGTARWRGRTIRLRA